MKAVSYTHLDVYKRQVLHNQTFLRLAPQLVHGETVNFRIRLASGKFVTADDAVSYTHLEVYKRQVVLSGGKLYAGP